MNKYKPARPNEVTFSRPNEAKLHGPNKTVVLSGGFPKGSDGTGPLKEYDREKEVVRLNPISNGTVLDHLPVKTAPKIINILKLGYDESVMIAINIDSKKKGKKDLIFIEGKKLSESEVQKLALLAEGSTWNIIKDKKVVSKNKIEMPKEFIGIIKCSNPKCITNIETIETKFSLKNNKGKCHYCEKEMTIQDIIKSLE